MRIEQVGAARLDYYDRNPTTRTEANAFALVAPHADTTRWTYTVPANRRCRLNAMYLRIRRSAVSGAKSTCMGWIVVNAPAGARSVWRVVNDVDVVNDIEIISNGYWGELAAGESIEYHTMDLSVGGTVDYVGSCVMQEFDA